MENVLKVVIYLAVGLLLVAVNIWYFSRVKEAILGSDMPKVIAPFQIVGKSDDSGKLSVVLAYMLKARLSKIREEMASSSKTLEEAKSLKTIKPAINPILPAQKSDTTSLEDDSLPDEVFTPLDLTMSVSGVEVGGILSWLHRSLTEDKALVVSVTYNGEKATASGNISTAGPGVLWVETVGTDDMEMIADVAYAITQRRFAERYEQVEALNPKEFRLLLTSLHKAAELNRQAALGRAGGKPYEDLLTKLEELVKEMPKWNLLIRLTAQTAERAEMSEAALKYYQDELVLTDKDSERQFLQGKITELNKQIEEKNAAGAELASLNESGKSTNETLIGKIRSIAGISSLDMSGTITIAVVGPTPPNNILPRNQLSLVGKEQDATTKSDPEMATYIGTIVQAIRLVAPKAQFMFVPINLSKDLTTFKTQIIGAMNQLLVLKTKPNVLLLPYSGLEGTDTGVVFQQLSSHGVTVVIPSGNDPSKPIPFANTPFLNNLMIVSAVDLDGRKTRFSPSHQSALWAPGDRIPMLVNSKVEIRAGTGYSAAIAAGISARVLESRKDLTPVQLIELLRTSSQKRNADGPPVISLANALSNKEANTNR